MTDVTASGERADVVGTPVSLLEVEHFERYAWAADQAHDRVLDVACGTGYGSAILQRHGQVTGLDKDAGALRLARTRVPEGDFRECTLPRIPFQDGRFDAVVTFETLEHVAEDYAYISEVRRVLRPGGVLFLSTPNAALTAPDGVPSNPWHVREYTLDELLALLAGFSGVEVFMQRPSPVGLRRVGHRVVSRLPLLRHPRHYWQNVAFGSGKVEPWDGRVPWYWVVRARRPELD